MALASWLVPIAIAQQRIAATSARSTSIVRFKARTNRVIAFQKYLIAPPPIGLLTVGRNVCSEAPMTSNLDIYRTASVLIWEHGDEADLVAAQRADEFLDKGDVDGSAVWKRVLKAIKEIQREEPHEGEAVN